MLTGASRLVLVHFPRCGAYSLLYYDFRGRELPLMIPVGDTLRRARLKRNLQLEEISNELKIPTRLLEAIENDQYDKLPGGVFAKSFVRQYARLLGLDEEEIAGRMQQAMGAGEETSQFPERPKLGSGAPIQVPKVDKWETVGDRRFRWSGWFSAVVLVAVMLVCSAVYAWLQRPKSPVVAQASPPVHSAVQSAPPPSATAQPLSPVEPAATPPQVVEQTPAEQKLTEQKPVEQQPAVPAPAAARVMPPNPDATVHVEITADEAVWVLARTDGKYAFSSTLEAHTTRTVEGVKDVMLRLGNAGGVTILLNGKPIGPAGPKGQVRTIQFTSGGFQIVPPKPPSAPAAPADRI
jgi:cytoskeleton protein RodZ